MRGVARKRRLTAIMSSAAAGATNERSERFQRLTTPLRLRVLADPHRAWQSSRCLDYTDEQLQQEFSLSRRGLLRRRTTAHLFLAVASRAQPSATLSFASKHRENWLVKTSLRQKKARARQRFCWTGKRQCEIL
jgi:hypothetical protein